MHQIGVGVLGPVFRTYEPSEDRLVAVKAFHLDITPEQARTLVEALERLITTELAHPGVVAPLAVGLQDDVPYLAQEYVAAESLDVAIRHYSPASLETALPFIRQMAAGVDAAHERSVVHGALHLRDIFVTPDEARMTGFGIVSALEEIGLAGPIRRPYTAPEVIAGRGWGAAADRFALAAIVYELLTGRRAAGTGDQVRERIRSIDGMSDPEHLEEVFATALADDPEDRYSSVNRFVSALESGVGEEAAEVAELANVQPEVDHHGETAPFDLLSGLELRHQESSGAQPLDSVEQLESTVADVIDIDIDIDTDIDEAEDEESTIEIEEEEEEDEDEANVSPVDQDFEPRAPLIDFDESEPGDPADNPEVWSVEESVELNGDAALTDDAGEDGGAELALGVDEFSADEDADDDGDRADLEVIAHPIASDDRDLVDDQEDDDGSSEDYPDAIPVLPSQAEDARNRRSVWSRGIAPVLAIAVVVGSIAYFLGVALAPNDGPTDQVLELQSASLDPAGPADPVNRELSDELVTAGAEAPAVSAAGSAPVKPSTLTIETPSDASASVESGSETSPVARPAPELPRVNSSSDGSAVAESPGTRTVRVPPPGAEASPEMPEVTPPTGWLLVRSEPPGATVALDGVGRGQTPLSLSDVSFGTHRLEVSRAGFETVQRDVTVNEQETVVPVGVRLTPASRSSVAAGDVAPTGSLAVRSRPPGARVMVDETVAGVTPLVVDLPVGRYLVRIQGDGYQAWVTNVEVTPSERAQVNASLERSAR